MISGYVSTDTRYFKNDTCYKFTIKSNVKYFKDEYKLLCDVHKEPVAPNIWVQSINGWYIIIELLKTKKESIQVYTGYNNHDDYNRKLNTFIKESN